MSAATPAAAVNAAARAVAKAASTGTSVTSVTSPLAAAGAQAVAFRSPPVLVHDIKMQPNLATNFTTFIPLVPLPDKAKLSPVPKMYVKKPRLHPYWKLHPKHKWRDFAPFVTKSVFTYDPSTEGSVGVRELYRHAAGARMSTQYPKCVVEQTIVEDGREATVSITWANGSIETCGAQWMDFEDILARFEGTRQKLQWAQEDLEML